MGEVYDDFGNLLSTSLANTNTNTNSLFGDGYKPDISGGGSTALTQSQDNSGNTLALNNNGILGSTALTQSQDNSGNTSALTLGDTSGFKPITGLDQLKQFVSDNKELFALGGAGLGMLSSSAGQKTGYQGGIPNLTATRNMIAAPPTSNYRPGQGGINYGGDVTYTRTPGVDPWANLSGNSAVDASGINSVYNNANISALNSAYNTSNKTSTASTAAATAAAAAAAKAAADLAAATKAGDAAAIAAAKAAADKAAAAAKAAADKAAADKAIADKAAADKAAADKAAADKAAADKAAADKAATTKTTTGTQSAGLAYALSHGMTAEQYYKNIFDYYKANSGLSDSMLKSEMLRLGVSAEDLAKATGGDLKAITSRFDAAVAKTPAELAAEQKAKADLAARTAQDTANKTAAEKAAADAAKAKAGSEGYQAAIKAGLTPDQYLSNINQWVADNSRATTKQIQDAMKEFGVSQTDLNNALAKSNFSAATKTALTTNLGLQGLNQNIQQWIRDNPYATNQQIQDAMKGSGTSDADIDRALNGLSASTAKEYAIVNDLGLDKLYQNILDYQAAGHTPEEVAAAMAATGVEQRDINAAAKFAADTGYTPNATSAAATQNFLNAGATNNVATDNGVVTNAATNSVVDNTAADRAAAEVAAIISGADTGATKAAEPAGLNTSNSIYQYFADPATQAALAAGDTRGIAETMQALGWSAQDVAAATGTNAADVQAAYDAALGQDTSYMQYAQGGEINMAKGRYLQGATDGMADELPAQIGQNQPAALSHGEFVIPADVVSHMGNGNSDAGAKKLYQMMDKIRMARTGTKKQGKKINPDKFMPGGLAQAYASGGKVKKFEEGGETTEQWAARQPDLSNIANAMERKNALESWQKQRPGYVDPTDFKDYDAYAGAAGIQSGKDAGNDLQNRANFYGMTIENYQNALSGDQTRPMGQFQQVYGNQLLSPIEQIAAQTARAQGLGEPNAYALELAKKNPEVFNTASQKWHDYMSKTYPNTLEYESVLKGPSVFDRTGMKKASNGGLASAYAKGGSVKHFLTGGSTSAPAGTVGVESNLSNWVGDYTTNMLGQGQALANMPYQPYMGQLTAGTSPLQSTAFTNATNLSTPTSIGNAATTAGNIATTASGLTYSPTTFTNQYTAPTAYSPTTSSFDATQASAYMNPYLKASLEPQLAEARRQSEMTQQQNAAKMTQAGAFGGSRQAILDAENQRSLGANLANITGQGYNTAYDKATAQFNADQARKAQEAQFGAQQDMTSAQAKAQYGMAGLQAGEQSKQFGSTYGLQGLQTGLQAAQTQGTIGSQENQAGLANLAQQLAAGAQERGIESEGIAADKAAFEEARANPYKMVQYQQSLLQGLPLAAQSYQGIEPSALLKASQGATTVNALLKNLGLIS